MKSAQIMQRNNCFTFIQKARYVIDVPSNMIDVFLFEKTVYRIGQPPPESIAFVRHFHIYGLEGLGQVLADLLEIGFDAKIP